MEPQEGDIADLPDGRTAVYQGGRWVIQGGQQSGWQVQPFTSPDDRRADARLNLAEETAARSARNEERRIEMDARSSTRQGVQSETDLRKEFNSLPDVREFPIVASQYNIVREAASRGTAAGDLALIFAFMKILDPGSVVREQEFSNAQNAGGIPDRFQALIGRLQAGERLSDNQRADFVAQARGTYETRAVQYNERVGYFRGLAEQYGFSPDNIAQPIEIDTEDLSVNRQNITAEEANDPNILVNQGYRYDPDTDSWVRDRGPDLTREGAAEERSADGQGLARRADAFVRGAADTLTFGLADEIAAAANTVLPLDRGSQAGWTEGFGQAYRNNLSRQRGTDDADRQDMPITRAVGQVAGGVAAPGAMTSGRFIAAAPNLAQAGVRGAMVGGAYGGAYGAGSAEGGLGERVEGAGEGAVTGAMVGGALGAGGRAVGNAVSGASRRMMTSPRAQQVQTLQDHGVSLTPGQRMGGLAKTVEDLGQRAPILGPAIRGARERGVESLNRAQGNVALDAIGDGVPQNVGVGGEMVGHVRDRLGAEFDRAYSMVPEINVNDPELIAGLSRIGQSKSDLPPAMQQQFDNIVSERLARLQGAASGQQVGAVRSELNTLASGYLKAQDPAQQALGRMIADLGDELDGAVSRASPEAGQILSRARDGYSDYVILERASTAAGGRPFGPGQLESAVRQSDGSVRRGAVGRGEARGQALANAARSVMPDQFGNPGSADAVGLGGLGVGMVTEPVTTTAVAAGLGAVSIPYLTMGRKIVERLPSNASRQQVDEALSQLDELARQDSNVIILRDEIARRFGRAVPAAAQQGVAQERLMTGTANR